MTEATARIGSDELFRLQAMSRPTGEMAPLPPRVPRRRADSVIAATLPAIAPVRAPRMRAPTLNGVPAAKAMPPIVVVEHAPPPKVEVAPPAPEMPVVAIAPAAVQAIRPRRFAFAVAIYALVLFLLLAVF